MSSILYGLKKVEVATVVNAETVPEDTNFSELCKTYRDSFEMSEEDAQVDEEFADQMDEPIAVFAQKGKTTIKFSTYDYDTGVLSSLLGGSIVSGEWIEGDGLGKETAIRFKTDTGHTLSYPKAKLFAKKNMKLVKNKVALIEVTVKPMSKLHIKKP